MTQKGEDDTMLERERERQREREEIQDQVRYFIHGG